MSTNFKNEINLFRLIWKKIANVEIIQHITKTLIFILNSPFQRTLITIPSKPLVLKAIILLTDKGQKHIHVIFAYAWKPPDTRFFKIPL